MKTNTTTAPLATSAAALVNEKQETIRPVNVLERDALTISDDGKVTIRDKNITASELALFIADRENTGSRFKTQARWAYYSAGQLQNGTEVQKAIGDRLREMLSTSAFHQLKSEATNIAPLIIANEIKSPLSVVKDAMAELKTLPSGKLAPMKEQTKAGRELIPLLKAGGVTQAKVREIRAKHTTATTGNRTPAAPVAGTTNPENAAVIAHANAVGALNSAQKYIDGANPQGDDRQAFVNLVTALARSLGLIVTVPGSSPVTARIVQAVQAKQEAAKEEGKK